MPADVGSPYLAASITALTAVSLWVASRFVESMVSRGRINDEKEKFIRALYAEIDFNTRDMEEFIANSPSIMTVVERVKNNTKLIPHITDARHTEIYRSKIDVIHFTGDKYIADVVLFYGLLEKIKSQIDGIYLPSYVMISGQGRANVINGIFATAESCADTGRNILAAMEDGYSTFKLRRKIRKAPEHSSDASLKTRMNHLALELDRVRTTHGLSS